MKWIINILTTALAVMISAYIIPSVHVSNYWHAIIVAIVLSFLNAFLKPIMIILTIPFTVLTFGIFLIFINTFMIILTDYFVDGFSINGFGNALLFSIILSIITSFFEYINTKEENQKKKETNMIELEKYNELEIARKVTIGFYLTDGTEDILLPLKYAPDGMRVGDKLTVFIYKDSEGRPIATTLQPYATVGEFVNMKVTDTTSTGAFLDWGIAKDLFVPFKEQEQKMETGKRYLVYIYIDEVTDRIVASAKYSKFLEKGAIDLKEDEQVKVLVAKRTDMGYNVIINNKYQGLLFENDVFEDIRIGDTKKAFIKKIREDNKIDVTLRKSGFELVDESKEIILEKLGSNNGFLSLNDESDPEEIKHLLKMSKKAFKKAIGGLYKEKIITFVDNGIRLN